MTEERKAWEPEFVWRRFGREHEKPCKRPTIITCAMWECQYANECRWDERVGMRSDPRSHPDGPTTNAPPAGG